MKELTSIKQKKFADNLISAGFTRKEITQALQEEFQITQKHATVLVYRWYVGKEFKVSRADKEARMKTLPYSKTVIQRIQNDAEIDSQKNELVNDRS